MYDTPEEILRSCVDRLGGGKTVGCRLKPELADRPDVAGRWLMDRLNEDRRERLSLQQAVTLLRWACEAGWHEGMGHWNRICGYGPSAPLCPQAEVADMQRRFLEGLERQERLLAQMKSRGLNTEGMS